MSENKFEGSIAKYIETNVARPFMIGKIFNKENENNYYNIIIETVAINVQATILIQFIILLIDNLPVKPVQK